MLISGCYIAARICIQFEYYHRLAGIGNCHGFCDRCDYRVSDTARAAWRASISALLVS